MQSFQFPLRCGVLDDFRERDQRNAKEYYLLNIGSLIITNGAAPRVEKMTDDHQRDILRILRTVAPEKVLFIELRESSDPDCVSQPLKITIKDRDTSIA